MKKADVVRAILGDKLFREPKNASGKAFAPSNIALCKYWGKRNQEINLPVTSSLSISLGDKGATTELQVSQAPSDSATINNQPIDWSTSFGKRLTNFLDLFREKNQTRLHLKIESNIPIAAGMASSASGFAALVLALDKLYGWNISEREASILARLGSGSASRSIWQGFVEWHAGTKTDGMDSYAEPLSDVWPDLCVGLLIVSQKEKGVSSREAMQRTIETSSLYSAWPETVSRDLNNIKIALQEKDFEKLGQTAESNAMTMHATMLSARPSITYFLPESITAMQKIWHLRHQGLPLYFTQDAGPNLKLLFLKKDRELIQSHFPIETLTPFS